MKWLIILILSFIPLHLSTLSIPSINYQNYYHYFNNPSHSSPNTIKNIKTLLDSFFTSLNQFFTNDIVIDSVSKCNTALNDLMTDAKIETFFEFFLYSGKGLSDIGFESECIQRGYSYFKVIYEVTLNQFSIKDEEEVIQFLNQKSFYTGLCLIHECKEAINAIQAHDNTQLFSYLETEYNLKKISLLYPPVQPYTPIDRFFSFFIIAIYCILGYILFKVILTVIKLSFFSSGENQLSNNGNNDDANNKELDEEGNEAMNRDSNSLEDYSNNKKSNKENKKPKEEYLFQTKRIDNSIIDHTQSKSLLLRFINFFDIFENITFLSSLYNKYYNDKRIALFTFVRFLLMFFVTYNHNFFTLTKMPWRDSFNLDFYTSLLFCFIKISIHCSSLWIILDGATFSYKFMSSIKYEIRKTNEKSVSILFILRWWLLTIPKIIVFFFIFYFFHYFMSHYKYFFSNSGTMFEYYLNLFQSRQCKDNPSILLIPFALSYKDSLLSYTYCYRFCYIFINEFYLFIFFTIYFYIAFKIRSKIVDYVFLVLTIANISLTTLSLPFLPNTSPYDLSAIFGQGLVEKYLHLFLNFYIIGIFIGMSYFYFYDAVSNHSLCQNDVYVPFCFCYTLVKYLDTIRYSFKKVLLYFLVFLCFLDALSFTFIRLVRRTKDNTLFFHFDTFINVYSQYEKNIFAIVFSLILILLLLFPKETTIRHIINSNLFIPFSRISFAYFCLSNTIIYVIYCVFMIQLKLSYPNLVYVTIGLLVINSFISYLIVIMFELPFRILIKKLTRCRRKSNSNVNIDTFLQEGMNNSMRILDDY